MTEDKEDVISPEVIEIQMKDVKVCHFAMLFLLLSYFASEVSEAQRLSCSDGNYTNKYYNIFLTSNVARPLHQNNIRPICKTYSRVSERLLPEN